MATFMYNGGLEIIGNGGADWDDGALVFRIMLVQNGYTPNRDHRFVSDVTNELSGTGYVRKTLAGRTVTRDDGTDKVKCDATDPVWTGINAGTAEGAVIYKQTGGDDSSPGNDDLVCFLDFSQVTNGGDMTLQFHADGVFAFSSPST